MAYTYARRKSSPARYARLLAVAVVLFPLSLTRIDFRSVRGLAVGAHHASPAYAAFEDLTARFDPTPISSRPALPTLVTGSAVDKRSLKGGLRHLALAGMTIRLPAKHDVEPKVLVAATGAPEDSSREADPTIGGVAARLVKRELAKRSPERVIASSLGTQIVVRGTIDEAGAATTSVPVPAEPLPTEFKPALSTLTTSPDQSRPFWLDGRLEMTGGLAHVWPETALVVKRTVDGRTLENGRIFVTEGKFEIHVAKPTGFLVAELQTRDGRVLGRGQISLVGVAHAAPGANTRIGDLAISLRPTTETASLRTISGYSHGHHKLAINDARVEIQSVSQAMTVDEDGYVGEPSLGPGSSFVGRASAPKHWPSLVTGQSDHPQDVRLLSNSMIDALIELNVKPGERRRAELEGVVWGQVSVDDVPVAGARVELTDGAAPIYFNDLYLPDRTLDRTGSNGLFAFVDVKPGVQAVRVRRHGRAYPAQVFATEAKHVSYVELGLRDRVVAHFDVRDVLNGAAPVPVDLKLVGTDARLRTGGDDDVELSTAGSSIMVEADAGPAFEISRTSVGRDATQVHLPIVRREWLSGLYDAKKLAPALDRGAVVGFVDGQDFEVEMTGGLLKDRLPIVYFDARGAVIEGVTGVAGGGFAILNAPTGLQTVHVHPTQARASYSQLVVAEPNLVQVMTWTPPAR